MALPEGAKKMVAARAAPRTIVVKKIRRIMVLTSVKDWVVRQLPYSCIEGDQ
jgi:hypothetical protein